MTTTAPYLVEEILEEILLRLPTPTALVRASIACASFRRIMTARSFVRRFRELHRPPLLGFAADHGGFKPVQESHPSVPLARALADAADFSYSYVTKPDDGVCTPWSPCDVRDGRVLLVCDCGLRHTMMTIFRKVIAVCDPLSRRHVLLPPLPGDMTLQQERLSRFKPVLAPIGDDEDETSFRVFCWANYESNFVIFVFSSASGKWCVAASSCWSSFGTVKTSRVLMFCFNYFHGNLYWTAPWGNKLLVLDISRMEISTVNILTSYHMKIINLSNQSRHISSVVVAAEGALEMFTLACHCSGYYRLYHTTQQITANDISSSSSPMGDRTGSAARANKCELKRFMALPPRYCYHTIGVTEGFLFLRGLRETLVNGYLEACGGEDLFSLDVETFEFKKVHGGAKFSFSTPRPVHPYFGFPPSLSKPSL